VRGDDMRAITRRAAIALGIGSVLVGAAVAFAATPAYPPSQQTPGSNAGSFYNYDYTSTSCAPSSPTKCTNLDWPVTMIFKGPHASVASVTTLLKNAGYNSTGSTEYAYVEQQGATTFGRVSTGGPKHFISTSIHPLINAPLIGWFSSVHIRLYAPSALGYFSGTDGVHYVIGTPHFDLNELFSPTYGWSEVAAEQVAADLVAANQVSTSAIAYDSVPLSNPEGTPNPTPWLITPREDGTHYWQSSGYATVVTIGKATLYVIPNPQAVTFGRPEPNDTFTLRTDPSAPSSAVSLPTDAQYVAPVCRAAAYAVGAAAPPSPLTISCSGGSDPNYAFDTSATALLTVGNAITISAANSTSTPQGATAKLAVKAIDTAKAQVLVYRAVGLPARLAINASTGVITGRVVAAPGTYTVRITVTDTSGAHATKTIVWHVQNDIVLTRPRAQSTPPNHAVHLGIKARDLIPHRTLRYAATGLPAGLAINAKTGVISGRTAKVSRVYTVTVVVTDSARARARTSCTWKV
jgi:hypothetical protein